MRGYIAAVLLAIACTDAEAAGELTFTEHLLQNGFGYAFGLSSRDLDGDGRPEIVVADADKGEMSCFVNQGNGSFQRFYIAQGEAGWLERNAIGDLDGNGKPDVAVVDNKNGQLLYFANPGTPIATRPWTRNVISATFTHAYDVCLADFYGNGRLDVAASSWISNQVAIFDNPGNGGGQWVQHTLDDNLRTARMIRAGDINGDGRPDLVATGETDNLIAWYQNPGLIGQPWSKHVIDNLNVDPLHGQIVDMNGDGKLDVLMAFGSGAAPELGQICWYENSGNGATWARHVVAGSFPGGTEAVAGDLNGDGRLEIVAAAWGAAGQVAWFDNAGDPAGRWTKHSLKQNWTKADGVLIVDLDLDGRLDIVAAAEHGTNEVRWWRNNGILVPEPSKLTLSASGLISALAYCAWRSNRHDPHVMRFLRRCESTGKGIRGLRQ
jgi:hypothetical protein